VTSSLPHRADRGQGDPEPVSLSGVQALCRSRRSQMSSTRSAAVADPARLRQRANRDGHRRNLCRSRRSQRRRALRNTRYRDHARIGSHRRILRQSIDRQRELPQSVRDRSKPPTQVVESVKSLRHRSARQHIARLVQRTEKMIRVRIIETRKEHKPSSWHVQILSLPVSGASTPHGRELSN
jgi:hypothetical protein